MVDDAVGVVGCAFSRVEVVDEIVTKNMWRNCPPVTPHIFLLEIRG